MNDLKMIKAITAKATCLYNQQQINAAIANMAQAITQCLAESNPVVLCVMAGGLVLTGNLLLRLNFPLQLDYIHATRYRGSTRGGDLHWRIEPKLSLANRTVLIIDDILDSGLTLAAIIDYCQIAQAKAVYTAVLVDKDCSREPGGIQEANFVGLKVENRFLFGYGLDYAEYLRNFPGIYAVAPEHQ